MRANNHANVVAASAAVLLPSQLVCALSGGYLWLIFFSTIPHKEERFMVPVYPLICFGAAARRRPLLVLRPGSAKRA